MYLCLTKVNYSGILRTLNLNVNYVEFFLCRNKRKKLVLSLNNSFLECLPLIWVTVVCVKCRILVCFYVLWTENTVYNILFIVKDIRCL